MKNCPVCGSYDFGHINKNPDFSGLDVVECKHCHFFYTQVEDGQNFYDYYKEEYRTERGEKASPQYITKMNFRAEAQKNFIFEFEPDIYGKKILEIGCGCGSLLKIFENYGCDLTGYEPDEKMFQTAQSRLPKAALYNDIFRPGNLLDESFDMVLLSHVLEHVEDLHLYLQDFQRILKPGGVLFIEVPQETKSKVINVLKYKKGNGHLWFFSSKNLKRLLKQYFSKLKIECYGMPLGMYMGQWFNTKMYRLFKLLRVRGGGTLAEQFSKKCKKGIYLRCCCRKVQCINR